MQVDPLRADRQLDRARGVELTRVRLEQEVAEAQPARPVPATGRVDLGIHQVRHAEEVGHVGIGGLVVDLLGGTELHDPPVVHDRQAVGHRQRLFLIVGDVQEGDADLLLQGAELDLEVAAELGVERAERLVQQQHRRAQDERPRQRDALLLAARELVRASLLEPGQLHQLERLGHPLLALGLRHRLVLHPERDVLRDGQEREQGVALEHRVDVAAVGRPGADVDAVEQDLAVGRRLEARDHPQRGRLPAAARPEQREELAGLDLQRDAVDRGDVVKPLRQ